jgi:nicotinamidase-related amidase
MTPVKRSAGRKQKVSSSLNLAHENSAKCSTALLLIDLINDMEFVEGRQLFRQTLPVARKVAALKKSARAAGVPIVYVNDNFGHWRSDLNTQIKHCLEDGVRGEPIARLLKPEPSDYFVLKPKSSAFFGTTLHTLLRHLSVKTVILTGIAADVCILFTAHDAHLRDYEIIVPRDCVASNKKQETIAALRNMEKAAHALICDSSKIDFGKLRSSAKSKISKHSQVTSLPKAS